nr:hypothetical protein [Candidatus Omnitrophota bacterium]
MEGLIKREVEDGVWLDIGFGAVKLRWEQIKSIYKSTPDEVKAIHQQWLKQEKLKEEKAGIKGYEESLLEQGPQVKQRLSYKILEEMAEAIRPDSLKKDVKLSLKDTVHWWIRRVFIFEFLLVGLFVLLSVSFKARLGRAIRIIVILIVIALTCYLLNFLISSLKLINIPHK